jgi:hypothetical protein
MGLREEILPYIQGNGLVAPQPVGTPPEFRTCDNGTQFSSEFYILLKMHGLLHSGDAADYKRLMDACVGADKYLHRSPGDDSLDEQDNHNGVYAGHIQLGLRPSFYLSRNLWRFPQLIALSAFASQKFIYRLLALPLVFYTALVILTSCINTPTSDTDARIGAWLVIKAMEGSALVTLAAMVWRRRLMADYPNGMRSVFEIYFGPGHPITRYSVAF